VAHGQEAVVLGPERAEEPHDELVAEDVHVVVGAVGAAANGQVARALAVAQRAVGVGEAGAAREQRAHPVVRVQLIGVKQQEALGVAGAQAQVLEARVAPVQGLAAEVGQDLERAHQVHQHLSEPGVGGARARHGAAR